MKTILRSAAAGAFLAVLGAAASAQNACNPPPTPYININSDHLQTLADASDRTGVWDPGSRIGGGYFHWPIGPTAETGWKLHVSFDPANYGQWEGALAHVLYILQLMRCEQPPVPVSHKLRPLETYAAFSTSAVNKAGAPILINGVPMQSGKLITIYTLTPEITAAVARRLKVAFEAANLVNAPHDLVPGDWRLFPGLPIFMRFGAANNAPGTTILTPPAGSTAQPIADDALKASGRAFPSWKNDDFLTITRLANQ